MRPQSHKGVETRSSVRYDHETGKYCKANRKLKIERGSVLCSMGHKHCFEGKRLRPRGLKYFKARIHRYNPRYIVILDDIVIS